MKKEIIWIAVALALFFLAGFFAGIFVERQVLDPRYSAADDRPFDRSRRDFRTSRSGNPRLDVLARELALSDRQKEQIEAIFENNKPEIDAFRERIRKEVVEIETGVSEEILKVLDEEQQVKYKELVERKMKKFRHGRHFKDRGGRDDRHKSRMGGRGDGNARE